MSRSRKRRGTEYITIPRSEYDKIQSDLVKYEAVKRMISKIPVTYAHWLKSVCEEGKHEQKQGR